MAGRLQQGQRAGEQGLTDAALDCRTAPNARGLQRTWDSVINARVVLQAVALGAMCVALVAS
ncbi:hypothetical protein O1M63_06705 [Streptomyces mirabilis]|nr:hypothetical protein [Streptomyces mirabilis]